MKIVRDVVTQRMKLKDVYPKVANQIARKVHRKADELELCRKFYPVDKAVEVDDKERTVTGFISTESMDRDREVVEMQGIDLNQFRKNPVVPWAHDYHGLPVGKSQWIKQTVKNGLKGLLAKTQFASAKANPFAENVFQCFKEGILRGFSIGFIPLKFTDHETKAGEFSPTRTYHKVLLLEYSPVPVPSNPDSLALALKSGIDGKLIKEMQGYIKDVDGEGNAVTTDQGNDGGDGDIDEVNDLPPEATLSPNGETETGNAGEDGETPPEDTEGTPDKEGDGDEYDPGADAEMQGAGDPIDPPDEDDDEGAPEGSEADAGEQIPDSEEGAPPEDGGETPPEEEEEEEEENILDENGHIIIDAIKVTTKPESTENYHHIPVRDSANFVADTLKTIDISEKKGIKAVVGKLSSDPEGATQVQKYMFDVKKWDMDEAKQWVADHNKAEESEGKAEKFQCECIDCGYTMESEDHCKDLKCPECGGQMRRAERPGPGQEAQDGDKANGIDAVILRMAEDSTELKAGRVLSKKNRDLIGKCLESIGKTMTALQDLLDATNPDPTPEVSEGDQGADGKEVTPDKIRSTADFLKTEEGIKMIHNAILVKLGNVSVDE